MQIPFQQPQRYALEFKYGVLVALLVMMLLLLNAFQIFHGWQSVFIDLSQLGGVSGFFIIYLIAMVGNTAVVVQIPYTLPLLSAALNDTSFHMMLMLGVFSGLGAGTGKLLTYSFIDQILARNSNNRLTKNKWFNAMHAKISAHPRWVPIYILVFLSLPLPDESVVIPLGMIRYGLHRIWHWLITGKVIHNIGLAILFYSFAGQIQPYLAHEIKAGTMFGVIGLMVLLACYQVDKTRYCIHQN